MGITLQQIKVKTTDDDGNEIFIDRTLEENKDKPLHKRIDISNIGFYYKTDEDNIVSEQKDIETTFDKMAEMFEDQSEKIKEYDQFYLLQPMKLEVKVTWDKNHKLDPSKAPEFLVNLSVDELGIKLLKK